MPKVKNNGLNAGGNDSGLNFEAQLWAAADKMRGHMDASEYKHVCLVQVLVAMLEPYKGRVFETLQSANIAQSQTLAALRDALLPKLLSGELRVPAAKTEFP